MSAEAETPWTAQIAGLERQDNLTSWERWELARLRTLEEGYRQGHAATQACYALLVEAAEVALAELKVLLQAYDRRAENDPRTLLEAALTEARKGGV